MAGKALWQSHLTARGESPTRQGYCRDPDSRLPKGDRQFVVDAAATLQTEVSVGWRAQTPRPV